MNDLDLTLRNLSSLVDTSESALPFPIRAGLYGCLRALATDLECYFDEHLDGDGYAHEKLAQVTWSAGAILGFDVTNRHGESEHRGWAEAAMWTLKSHLAASQ